MNESTAPHSEIIELLEKTIKENERKLNVLSNELNKTPKKSNRFHELTHIIRITKQELEFNKEDLKSAENTNEKDETMKTDKKNNPQEADIETAFEKIHKHRKAIAMVEQPYKDKIEVIDDDIDTMISDLMEDRARLVKQMSEDTEQTNAAIEILTDEIKKMVLENGKTCSTVFGTCTYVKGRKASIKWDDAALMGYVSASPDHDTLLQFRTEGKEGAPSTRFKLAD